MSTSASETACETDALAQGTTACDFSGNYARERTAFRNALFEWCLRSAQRCYEKRLTEEGLRWDLVAGTIAHFDCSPLASPLLESHVIEAGRDLATPESVRPDLLPKPYRWLHVLNVACPVGGHTAMAARWMRMDCEESCHSVVLLEQQDPVPSALVDAVAQAKGEILTLDPKTSILDRATWLRGHAWQHADVVVLHVSPFDVISTAAFAVPGGPPVLLVNHAAHIFWVGCAIADFVLNCRGSALEHRWTIGYRGIEPDRSVTLPIPIPTAALSNDVGERARIKKAAKEALQVPPEAEVVLTVGNTNKYRPVANIDFLDAAKKILEASDSTYLLAVGVDEDPRWKAVREGTGGRLRAVGSQSDLKQYHAAADVYIEGFPFGSTTALLEAGSQGIPCILAPAVCPPPFTSDGISLDTLDRPPDLDAYVRSTVLLLEDEPKRLRLGRSLAASISSHHCGSGWLLHLKALKEKVRITHKVYPACPAPSVSRSIANYWSAFATLQYPDPLAFTLQKACTLRLKPSLDPGLKEALIAAAPHRSRCFLIDWLAHVTGPISALLPSVTASTWYGTLFSIFRPEGRILRTLYAIKKIGARNNIAR